MASNFHLPPMGFGPGSQPDDDAAQDLTYMAMPQEMSVYVPHVPELEDAAAAAPAIAFLRAIAAACARVADGGAAERFDLSNLDATGRSLVLETLGEGEVGAKLRGIPAVAVQESRYAGVWMLSGAETDQIEIATIPDLAKARAHDPIRAAEGAAAAAGHAVINAPPILSELADKSAQWTPGAETHVVNLSLLPHTEEDLLWLDAALGEGAVTILSRGYGNCRITATATPQVWRVQFFNSVDVLILDTFEVTAMPEVALAAPEDLSDSARRLVDVLEAMA